MLRELMTKSQDALIHQVADWLRRGISPRRLALTLALGFAVGCVPVVGIPTLICAALAVSLRLNFAAIQVANYAAMPLQLLLLVHFVRLGGWLFDAGPIGASQITGLLHKSPVYLLSQLGGIFGHALAAWLLLAIPAVALLTFALTGLLRRVPALEPAPAGD
jgi:uncharacterized protein (DUF2062 family)